MTEPNYPCKKCNEHIPNNTDSICCDICDIWFHVRCSGLTFKSFKKLTNDINSRWFCSPCLKECFPFGQLGPVAFENFITPTVNSNLHVHEELLHFIQNNNFTNKCSICDKKTNIVKSVPCSTCNSLLHQKCAKYKLKNLKDINDIQHWQCPKCKSDTFPFHDISNDDLHLLSFNISPPCKLNLESLRNNFNFSKLSCEIDSKSDESSEFTSNNYCNYYDINEFKSINKIKTFSIFHTNIGSLPANIENLQTLICNLQHNFDIISLTETWNQTSKNDSFLPNNIEGYQKYNGISGDTQNSGSGFYIKSDLNYIERNDLDSYKHLDQHEFSAKWIEIPNDKSANILIASIYRHPSSQDTQFHNYYHKYFIEFKNNTKKTWEGINKLLSKVNKSKSTINLFEDNNLITDQKEVADKFNTFFTNIGPTLSEQITDLGHHFSEFLPTPYKKTFFLTPTTPNEIALEIRCLSDNTASDIPIKLIKIGAEPISITLSNIFNHSFQTGTYIDKFKFALVSPIHKGDSKLSLTNYRPITVLPIFSKILERVMHRRLLNFLSQNNLLFEHQFGFQPKRTTNMAILDIYSKIVNSIEDTLVSCCVFLDFAKAFDTVNHAILLSKLENIGIRGLPLLWFQSYLHKRQQITKINNTTSAKLEIRCRVPQGSVLGPILFLVYINDIYKSSSILKFHLFADDTSLFLSAKNEETLKNIMNRELILISNWLSANKLSLNVSKSSLLVFHPPQKKINKIEILINSQKIPEKASTKYLGVIIDKHLTWQSHVTYLNTKLNKAIGILSKLRYFVPLNILRTLYCSFFKSHIDYCTSIWTCTTKTTLEPINISMKKATRVMTFSKPDSHAAPLFKKLKLLDLSNHTDYHLGILSWDICYNTLPSCLLTALNFNKTSRFNRKIKPSTKFAPLCRTLYKSNFITSTAPLVWKNIPSDIKSINSRKLFTAKFRHFLLD